MSTRNEDKEARERAIFAECAEIAGLRVREGSVVSRPPPEPDILCEISRSRVSALAASNDIAVSHAVLLALRPCTQAVDIGARG